VEPPKNDESKKRSETSSTFSSLSEAYRKLAPYLNIGYFFAASVTGMTLLGYYLDKKWQTDPWLTVCGAVLGIGLGFYNFFKTVFNLEKKDDK
jgi:F0F1-type ATP synthase assembly protein I